MTCPSCAAAESRIRELESIGRAREAEVQAHMEARFAAEERARELEAQLPEGMKHCAILFKECEKGHGWLTATNWVPFSCPTCALAAAEKRVATSQREIQMLWHAISNRDEGEFVCRADLMAALTRAEDAKNDDEARISSALCHLTATLRMFLLSPSPSAAPETKGSE